MHAEHAPCPTPCNVTLITSWRGAFMWTQRVYSGNVCACMCVHSCVGSRGCEGLSPDTLSPCVHKEHSPSPSPWPRGAGHPTPHWHGGSCHLWRLHTPMYIYYMSVCLPKHVYVYCYAFDIGSSLRSGAIATTVEERHSEWCSRCNQVW